VPGHRGGEVEFFRCRGCNVQALEVPDYWQSETVCNNCWQCPGCLVIHRFEPEDDYVCYTCRYGGDAEEDDQPDLSEPLKVTGLERFALDDVRYDQSMNRGDRVPPDPDDAFFIS
jgi:hypothetical protein